MRGIATLRTELDTLSATPEQRSVLETNPTRGVAAIAEARKRGASDVAKYAVVVFNNSAWTPKGAEVALATNRYVAVDCQLCGGDRLVLVRDYDPKTPYDEAYKRCPACNSGAK